MLLKNAKWIGFVTDKEFSEPNGSLSVGAPCPYLRKEFTINNKIKSARLFVTSLGLYDFYINGKRISEDRFNPGWTDYNKRFQYSVYNVKNLLISGINVLGCILGDGWYCGNIAHVGRGNYGSYPLLLLALLEIKYIDGTSELISTDRTWKASKGEIIYSDMLMGEFIDATKKLNDWNESKYNDSDWENVNEYDKTISLIKQKDQPVRINQEIYPTEEIAIKNSVAIIDMNQNMVGWVSMAVKADRGAKIKLRFGEMLDDNGQLYTENLRTAQQTDYYICCGEEVETFEPHFTYHGFRFVEITIENGNAEIIKVIGKVVNSSLRETSYFECSNDMVNQLFSNILWGQRGNFFSVPTDCPQRNERMGWTGDAQIFCKSANYNMDSYDFFKKYLADIRDAQKVSGAITDVAPQVINMGAGNAAWGDAIVIIPYTLYLFYGKEQIISENYSAMKKWVDYCIKNSDNYIRPDCGYGDWLSIEADTPKNLLATAFFAYSTDLISKMAGFIDKYNDEIKYAKILEEIKEAFRNKFMYEDGKVCGGTQTAYLLAIKFNLVDEKTKRIFAKHLVEDIKSKGYHLSTGFVGVSYLLPVLCDMGYSEIAHTILLNDSYPSWGYSIKNGATTIWERWNSYTKETGFGDVGMNSFNHYSLGSVSEWMMGYMGGIRIDERNIGFGYFILQPIVDPLKRITKVTTFFDSINGRIESKWHIDGNTIKFEFNIPENISAKIILPNGYETNVGMGKFVFFYKI